MTRWVSEKQIVERLRIVVCTAGSLRVASGILRTPSGRLSEFLSGKRRITRSLIERLGFDPIPHYRKP